MISNPLKDGRGLEYVAGSYQVVGNDGTVAPNRVITATPTMSATVVSAFGSFSDHLPVAAKYSYRLLGDPTGDDIVAFNDFLTLQNHFGVAGTIDQGDFDFDFDYDGVVDSNDFLILQNHYGTSAILGSAPTSPLELAALRSFAMPVPEPTCVAGLLLIS